MGSHVNDTAGIVPIVNQLRYSLVLKSFEFLRLFGDRRLHVQVRSKIAVFVQLQGGVIQLREKNRTRLNKRTRKEKSLPKREPKPAELASGTTSPKNYARRHGGDTTTTELAAAATRNGSARGIPLAAACLANGGSAGESEKRGSRSIGVWRRGRILCAARG